MTDVQQPTEQPLSHAVPESASFAESLAWLPATSAAVSLRLFAIDAAIIYRPGDPPGREVIQVSLANVGGNAYITSAGIATGLMIAICTKMSHCTSHTAGN